MIGLGIMGRPMAKRLIQGGVPLMVSDLNHEAVAELTALGAEEGSYAQIGEACDIVITILPNGSVVHEVLFGEDGVAGKMAAGGIICDMSSVTPKESRECYRKLREMGIGFLDAPVSGGEPGAVSGELAIMCGGDEADFGKMRKYFGLLGKSFVLIGESGAGSVTKLVNQIIVNMGIAAVSEGLVLAVRAGVDPLMVYQAIRTGLAGSAVLDAKASMICKRDFKAGGKIGINHKDIKNVINTSESLNLQLPLTSQLFEIMEDLMNRGLMDEDHGAIVKYFEKLSGVTVKSDLEISF